MKKIVVYDNTIRPNEIIREVIGDKGFGDVVVKRKTLKTFYKENVEDIYHEIQWIETNNFYDMDVLLKELENNDNREDIRILHCFSDYIISDVNDVALTYKKLDYIDDTIQLLQDKLCFGVMFCDMMEYLNFLKRAIKYKNVRKTISEKAFLKLEATGLSYIGEIANFIQCITGNFDSRYFNSLQGTQYYLRKSSTNKKKIESEYKYYHLLPENMQSWFVMPYDYKEDDNTASYAMERLHMTDIAIKWVHGSIGKDEFSDLMDMYFYFFNQRSEKIVTREAYDKISTSLYKDKVEQRISDLKKLPEFKKIANLLANNDKLLSIDAIYERYLKLKEKVEKRVEYPIVSVIGHGDPCFANAMYNRSTRTLKFIDPKGALCEDDLWTNAYYDIAKLSHSVCGRYDFFNNAMFDITIDENFEYCLSIPFDNEEYKEIFRKKVEENGFDYWTVRLYEASLFLSMLPLHIDYPHKVFGFILNAVSILEEIEENV